MKSGWKCWKVRLGILLLASTTIVGGAAIWSLLRPRSPAELYRARCSACHALPDLSNFSAKARAAIVETMRENNGADRVISDVEAATITEYLVKGAERNGS